jgi:ABC-type multidrug transport system fused ATPase/permease subunit
MMSLKTDEPWRRFAVCFTDIFRGNERWRIALSVSISILSAAVETISVASVLPFVAVTLDPSIIDRYPNIQRFLQVVLGKVDHNALIIWFGSFLLVVIVCGNCIGALNIFVQEKMAARIADRLGRAIFADYLAQPYSFHLKNDSSSLLQVLLDDVRNAKINVVVPVLLAPAKIILVVGMCLVIFSQNPVAAMVASLLLVGSYVAVFRMVRSWLKRLGAEYMGANVSRIRLVQEALGGIKELRVLGRAWLAVRSFSAADHSVNDADSAYRLIEKIPRFVMEIIGMSAVLTYMLWLASAAQYTAAGSVPSLAMYVFAGYRLLPALQGLFASSVQIRFSLPAFYRVHKDFMSARLIGYEKASCKSVSPLDFSDKITFEGVAFQYDEVGPKVLENINLAFRKGESVGIVGRTGAGKSTLADLLLGVVAPTEGKISIDGVELSDESLMAAWQKNIGYVPQQVFLSNGTIVENIAFGLPMGEIDMDRVVYLAQLAQIDEFIRELPEQFSTIVGERGVKLSGGERQRIGIARALYRRPGVIVLDEATSALDNLTESAVASAIDEISRNTTLIVIAHRFHTVQRCDRIIMLESGKVVCDGSYKELIASSEKFREMAG